MADALQFQYANVSINQRTKKLLSIVDAPIFPLVHSKNRLPSRDLLRLPENTIFFSFDLKLQKIKNNETK